MALIRQTLDDVKCSPDTIYSPSRASAATSVPLATPTAGAVGSVARGDPARTGAAPAGGVTVPKRLRPYFLYSRALLGDLSRVAARTITAFIRATVAEPHLSLGLVASIQTQGSLANWQPHLHVLVTDGGFRPDGTLVRCPGGGFGRTACNYAFQLQNRTKASD